MQSAGSLATKQNEGIILCNIVASVGKGHGQEEHACSLIGNKLVVKNKTKQNTVLVVSHRASSIRGNIGSGDKSPENGEQNKQDNMLG